MQGHQFQAIQSPLPHPARMLAGLVIAALAASMVAIEHGFGVERVDERITATLQVVLSWIALIAADEIRWRRMDRTRWRGLLARVAELAILLAALAELLGFAGPAEGVAIAGLVAIAIRLNSVLAQSMRNPSILFPASFLVLIGLSAALLKLPAATPSDQPITWIDAVFTATSAVCVTGLAVRDTAADFTFFGQSVILASIQFGGLGVMIFGSTLALLFGGRLSYRENLTLSAALDEYPAHRIARFAWFIVLTTFLIEVAGALAIYLTLPGDALLPAGDRVWFAVFHSISAFCNAGFDISGASMIPLRSTAVPYIAIAPLIILGGLGFIVLEDIFRQIRDRIRGRASRVRLSTHSKLVLTTTVVLLFAGAGVILLAQSFAVGGVSFQGVLDAAFMSITARTAGFTTVPMDDLSPGSRFMLMVLMAIGGSPGSTAGGMKTLVVAVLALAVIATVRGRDEVEVFGRALPDALVKRAATVAAGFFGVVTLSTLLLDLMERFRFEPLLFEVVSAATTTGLSLGITADLSPPSRVVITITMFLGRVGALALLASLVGITAQSVRYRLPRDTVSLG